MYKVFNCDSTLLQDKLNKLPLGDHVIAVNHLGGLTNQVVIRQKDRINEDKLTALVTDPIKKHAKRKGK